MVRQARGINELRAVNELDSLCTGLSRKIWQKTPARFEVFEGAGHGGLARIDRARYITAVRSVVRKVESRQ